MPVAYALYSDSLKMSVSRDSSIENGIFSERNFCHLQYRINYSKIAYINEITPKEQTPQHDKPNGDTTCHKRVVSGACDTHGLVNCIDLCV